MTPLDRLLTRLGACEDARTWTKTQPNIPAAWKACERADWMLWFLAKTANRKLVVSLACKCARTALPLYERKYPGDKRPRVAILAAERSVRGKATLDEVRAAATDELLRAVGRVTLERYLTCLIHRVVVIGHHQ